MSYRNNEARPYEDVRLSKLDMVGFTGGIVIRWLMLLLLSIVHKT